MKKRNKHFFKKKRVIKLKSLESDNRKAIRAQGYIELAIPIHDGYDSTFVLRPDILNRTDASAYQEALDICNTKIWSKKLDFKYYCRSQKKWFEVKPKLSNINKKTYESLSIESRKLFYEIYSLDKYWRIGFYDKTYKCILSYELNIVKTNSYITHRREHNSDLYSKRDEVEALLYKETDGSPWGSLSYYSAFEIKQLSKREKLKSKRDLNEIIKNVKNNGNSLDI